MQSLDNGNVSSFNKYFQKFVPDDIKLHNIECQKLEFYVNIHCAVHPFRITSLRQYDGNAELASRAAASSIHMFSKYLNTRGQSLSKTQEFLPYFALPYIPSPIDHPSFKLFFDERWTKNLKSKLDSFLTSTLKQLKYERPELYNIYSNSNRISYACTLNNSAVQKSISPHKSGSDIKTRIGEEEKQEVDTEKLFKEREIYFKEFSYNVYTLAGKGLNVFLINTF